MKEKRTLLELCLLAIMPVCYAGCIYCFITNSKNDAIAFFVLHSCLMLAYFFMLHVRYTRILLADYTANTVSASVTEYDAKEISDLKAQCEALLCETAKKDRQIADLTAQNKTNMLHTAQDSVALQYSLLPKQEQKTDINILSIANAVTEHYHEYAAAKGGNIVVSSTGSELKMKASPVYITLLFQNIVDNSIKYMGRFGSLVITLSGIGESLFIAFKDNGETLSDGEIKHIFDLNYQGINRCGGSGLGLAQAKAIVEHYNGTITAKSENGVGIYIKLPSGIQ